MRSAAPVSASTSGSPAGDAAAGAGADGSTSLASRLYAIADADAERGSAAAEFNSGGATARSREDGEGAPASSSAGEGLGSGPEASSSAGEGLGLGPEAGAPERPRSRSAYQSTWRRQYVYVAATLPAEGGRSVGNDLKRMQPDAVRLRPPACARWVVVCSGTWARRVCSNHSHRWQMARNVVVANAPPALSGSCCQTHMIPSHRNWGISRIAGN